MIGVQKKRARTGKLVQFAPGTIFYERVGAYVPPVAIRNMAEVLDADVEEADEVGDLEWFVRCAGVGACVFSSGAAGRVF